MTITKKSILHWELVGIGVIFLVGALFHFIFFEDPHAHIYGIFETIRTGPGATIDSSNSLVCPSDFCRKPQLDETLRSQCVQKTRRNLADFKKLTLAMTLGQVCGVVGVPDWETGSGLMILVYDLKDGSRIFIGFGGPPDMVYIHRFLPDGSTQVILGQ
jgi:hypothetical protein